MILPYMVNKVDIILGQGDNFNKVIDYQDFLLYLLFKVRNKTKYPNY